VHDKQVRRRRTVLALLVGVSLILLTAYFGESPNSPLHTVQRGIVEVLSPIQDGASKALKPVRDVAGWFSGTFNAKAQRDQLRKQVQMLEAELAQAKGAQIENQQLNKQLGLDEAVGLSSHRLVGASVITRDPTLWYQTIEIDKGSDDGVRLHDPVVGDGALVGEISFVGPTYSFVSLITDHSVSVTARVLDQNGDTGELVPAVGNPNQLVLQDLQITNPSQVASGPQVGQQVTTAGFRSGPLDSLFPAGIPIGQVSSVNDNQLVGSGQIQVSPDADLRHLDIVQVLTQPQAGAERAQLP
jgi:rod shape-determining protein MreC